MNSITKLLEAGLCELWHSSYSLQAQIPQLRTYVSLHIRILYTLGQNVQYPTHGMRLEASSSVCYCVQRIHYILVLKVHACTHTVGTTQHKHESKDCMICSLSALQRVLLLHAGSASIAASAVGTKETYDMKASLHTHHTRVHAHWGWGVGHAKYRLTFGKCIVNKASFDVTFCIEISPLKVLLLCAHTTATTTVHCVNSKQTHKTYIIYAQYTARSRQ